MRPGVGGILADGAGVGVTLFSKAVVWYGALVVGIVGIVRGTYRLSQPAPHRELAARAAAHAGKERARRE